MNCAQVPGSVGRLGTRFAFSHLARTAMASHELVPRQSNSGTPANATPCNS